MVASGTPFQLSDFIKKRCFCNPVNTVYLLLFFIVFGFVLGIKQLLRFVL